MPVRKELVEIERTVADLREVESGLRRRVSDLEQVVESLNLDVSNTRYVESCLRAELDRLSADLRTLRRRTRWIIFSCLCVIVVLILALAAVLTK